MARSQTWTRNISKQRKRPPAPLRAIVPEDPLAGIKRRAEDLGLIIHARQEPRPQPQGARKKGGKK